MEIEAALVQLDKVRLTFGLGHPSDEDRIRRLFGPLFGGGHKIDPRVCHSWALARGWDKDEAAELKEVLSDMTASRLKVRLGAQRKVSRQKFTDS